MAEEERELSDESLRGGLDPRPVTERLGKTDADKERDKETIKIPLEDSLARLQTLARDLAAVRYDLYRAELSEDTAEQEEIRQYIASIEQEIVSTSADHETSEAYLAYYNGQVQLCEVTHALTLQRTRQEELEKEIKRQTRQMADRVASPYSAEKLTKMRQEIMLLKRQESEALQDPEVALAWRSHQLREYRRQWRESHFVKTPTRLEMIEQVEDMWSDGKKVFATGPTGTGKTELIKRAAAEYSGEPSVISGHQGLTTYEVYGKPKLGAGKMTEGELQEWQDRISQADTEREAQLLLARFSALGGVVSDFTLGKLPQAAKDGRVVIYDELDLVPTATQMRHKADFNLRVGETFSIQEDSGIQVPINEGFAIAATANLKGVKHKEREEIDPAMLRLFEAMPVGFFPPEEMYDIALATLIDRRGALTMSRSDAEETLKRLVDASVDIQACYLGTTTSFFEKSGGTTTKHATLEKALLDPGKLLNMLSGWRRESLRGVTFKDYIEREIISFINNEAYTEKERYTLLEIFTRKGFLLGANIGDFLPSELTPAEWTARLQGKTGISDEPPMYLDPRTVATLDPFELRTKAANDAARGLIGRRRKGPKAPDSPEPGREDQEWERTVELKSQYDAIFAIYKARGIIKTLSTGESGIVATNAQEYPMPRYEQVVASLEAQPLLGRKIEQGLTRLVISPIGLPVTELAERYKEVILDHHKRGALKGFDGKALELDEANPVFVWDKYQNEQEWVYDPTSFDKDNPGGKTKQQVLAEEGGFRIYLTDSGISNNPDNLPRRGQGRSINGRSQMEGGLTGGSYLEQLRNASDYTAESGFGPEDFLSLAIDHLERTDQVLGEIKSGGTGEWLLGAYYPADDGVAFGHWGADARRARLGRNDPGVQLDDWAGRVGMRGKPLGI